MRRARRPPGRAGVLAAAMAGAALLSGCTLVGAPAPGGPSPAEEAAAPSPPEGPARRTGDGAAEEGPGDGSPARSLRPPATDEVLDVPPSAAEEIPDAEPRAEPLSRYGNRREYTVNGRSYRVMESAEGYEAEGVASWYGEEFHGRLTSSREPYDMDAMTAAHRSLPLPTYVEVVNLDNGRKALVRVNDRGPFVDTGRRIIDVSYAAARKLGMLGSGLARVRIRALPPFPER